MKITDHRPTSSPNTSASSSSNSSANSSASDPSARPRARRGTVAALSTGQLEDELANLARRLATGTYELLVLVGEYDARGTWALHGALSCAAWLARLCDIETCTARTQVRVARVLREHPELDAAMASGDLSYAKARVLVPWLTDANANELITIAESTPAGHLGAAIAAWAHRNDDHDLIEAHQRDARSCTWHTQPDGTISINARLTPAAAGAVCALIDAQVGRATPMADAPAGADAGTEPVFPTLAQQRADALVTIVTQGSGGNVDAEVVVHVTADGNHLTDGTPLTDHTVTRILPEALVSLLLHDAQRRPIDASPRRRFPTRRQRRVVDTLNPECAQPGCHARDFLQYDHVLPYADGGSTTLDNLQRLCGPHNRLKATATRSKEAS